MELTRNFTLLELTKSDTAIRHGINNNPTSDFLENAIKKLYRAQDAVLTPSGLTAIVIPFLTYLKFN